MSMQIRWLGTACFQICLPNGEVILIDPYMDEAVNCPVSSGDIERADLICLSHGHFDHILDVGRLANRLGSTVLCSRKVAQNIRKRFDVSESQIRVTTVGEVLREKSVKIEVVNAIHVDNKRYFAKQLGIEPSEEMTTGDVLKQLWNNIKDLETKARMLSYLGKYPGGEQLNFIFQFPGNMRLYFFGSVPELELFPIAEQSDAEILILQLLRGYEEKAVALARRSGASIVIPSHHDAFIPGQKLPDLKKVVNLFEKRQSPSFLNPEAGEWYEIETVVKQRK